MRNLKLLLAAVAVLVGATVVALDAPHDGSFATSATDCDDCHKLHGGGGTLTNWATNNDGCLTCHNSAAVTANHFFSPAWGSESEAAPGTSGNQHKWSGSPTARGAKLPDNAMMARYLTDGKPMQCAVCHDAHGAKEGGLPVQDLYAPNSAHSSIPLNVEQAPNGGGSAGGLTLISISDGGFNAIPMGYAVRVKPTGFVNGVEGYLEVSHDITAAVPTWTGNIFYTVGNTIFDDVWLDDPYAAVVVRMTKSPAIGDTWKFYISYPLLRATNVADAMCTDCHADRKQNHACVEGSASETDGAGVSCVPDGTTRYYSHPVNQPLNANGRNYDAAAPLDADGTAQGEATEVNPSNKLALDGGNVRCTTCHAPHNADSNSLSVDVR